MVFSLSFYVIHNSAAVDSESGEGGEIENKIPLHELPLDVIATIKESWGYITDDKIIDVEKFEKENKVYYEVEFQGEDANQFISVKTTASGIPIEIERKVDASVLPKGVMNTINSAYPNMKVEEADVIFNIAYEIQGIVDNQSCEIKVDGTGRMLTKECENI